MTTAEATTFAAQYSDRKVYPTQASHEFLETCIGVNLEQKVKQGDVCPNGVPALVEKGNNDDHSDSE